MTRRLLRWTLIVILAVPALLVIAGTIASWPLWALPETTIKVARVAPMPAQDRPTLEAGVAIRDITPPIGLPKFGYSALAHDADGFRSKLRSRMFCIKPAQGLPVAIVQVDLGASSLLLHHRVAELIAGKTDVPMQNLAILATHTHSGPGQYLESNFYNAFGTNRPGFDPKLFDFLASRISDGVISACNSRRPARIGIAQTSIWGLTRNRSLAAWLNNYNVDDKTPGEERTLVAVNPVMSLVRIDLRTDDGRWMPAGAITSFSIHGTGIPADSGPWHADVWGSFEQEIEWAIRARYNPPWPIVHAAFEGTHGDNNPNWRNGQRGEDETNRIGKELAEVAARLFNGVQQAMGETATIRAGMREIDLLTAPPAVREPLCDRAILGAATAGAANGDEVFPISYLPYFQEGWPRTTFTGGCQAQKQWMLSQAQPLFMHADDFPHRAAVQVVMIGEIVLVALPWEVTTEAGSRIAARVTAQLRDAGVNGGRVVVASHANGYFGYATTPEEYALQYYEGGHTLYGPGTTEFLARESARLTGELIHKPTVADLPDTWEFPLRTRSYWPEAIVPKGERALISNPEYVRGDKGTQPYWTVVYRDVEPGELAIDQPLLRIEALREPENTWVALTSAGRPVNDQWQRDLQIRWLGNEADGMARYELRWNNPPVTPNFRFRFAVAARAGLPEWYSPRFPH